jgi:hypothetical protein
MYKAAACPRRDNPLVRDARRVERRAVSELVAPYPQLHSAAEELRHALPHQLLRLCGRQHGIGLSTQRLLEAELVVSVAADAALTRYVVLIAVYRTPRPGVPAPSALQKPPSLLWKLPGVVYVYDD